MRNHDDLLLEDSWVDPLDQLDDDIAAPPPPDPDEMLALLTHAEAPQRMLAARAFCEIADERAVAPLVELLVSVTTPASQAFSMISRGSPSNESFRN